MASANSHYPLIDNLVNKIKEKRQGLSPIVITNTPNPFIDEKTLKKEVKKVSTFKQKRLVLRLYAILDKRAKINGRWYRIGSKLYGYRLVKTDPLKGYVVLLRKNRVLRLFVQHKRKKRFIKIKDYR